MPNHILVILIISTVFASCPTVTADDIDCAAMLKDALVSDIALTYEEFDQTQGRGFRRLADNNCQKEAADLIEAYITANNAHQNSLIWHIAQLRAAQGDYGQALIYARKSLNPAEDLSEHPLRWNDYVRGVIAFLESDKEALVYHRDRVALGVEAYFGNELNRKVLDSYITHFGRSYAYASSRVGK